MCCLLAGSEFTELSMSAIQYKLLCCVFFIHLIIESTVNERSIWNTSRIKCFFEKILLIFFMSIVQAISINPLKFYEPHRWNCVGFGMEQRGWNTVCFLKIILYSVICSLLGEGGQKGAEITSRDQSLHMNFFQISDRGWGGGGLYLRIF